jgi:hypothetical protein
MLKEVGSQGHSNTVFMNHSPAGLSDVSGQIRSAFMEANAAKLGGGRQEMQR